MGGSYSSGEVSRLWPRLGRQARVQIRVSTIGFTEPAAASRRRCRKRILGMRIGSGRGSTRDQHPETRYDALTVARWPRRWRVRTACSYWMTAVTRQESRKVFTGKEFRPNPGWRRRCSAAPWPPVWQRGGSPRTPPTAGRSPGGDHAPRPHTHPRPGRHPLAPPPPNIRKTTALPAKTPATQRNTTVVLAATRAWMTTAAPRVRRQAGRGSRGAGQKSSSCPASSSLAASTMSLNGAS